MARKLKVFQTRLGFYDSVVAAASQAAALRAWGTHHNLFADGMAELATDEKATEAALQQPEVPLKRAIGTGDAFGLNPGLPKLPDMAPDRPSKAKAPPIQAKPAPKVRPRAKPVDRSALDRAEAALTRLAEDRRREETAFQAKKAAIEAEERTLAKRRKDLEASEAAAAKRFEAARAKAEAALGRERKVYKKAGGA